MATPDPTPYKSSSAPISDAFRGPRTEELRFMVYENRSRARAAVELGEADLLDLPVEPGTNSSEAAKEEPCDVWGFYSVAIDLTKFPQGNEGSHALLTGLILQARAALLEAAASPFIQTMNSLAAPIYGGVVNPFVSPRAVLAKQGHKTAPLNETGPIRILIPSDDEFIEPFIRALKGAINDAHSSDVTLIPVSASAVAHALVAREKDWEAAVFFTHIMDNVSSWKPAMFKTRYTPTFLADFLSTNCEARNYSGLRDQEYDIRAKALLTTLRPFDIRPAVLYEQAAELWQQEDFWRAGGSVRADCGNALLLAWKLQAMIAERSPVIPLFVQKAAFLRASSTTGVWNGKGAWGATHHGGLLSYWTFQRIANASGGPVCVALSDRLGGLNPLAPTTYRDTLVWTRIFEPLLSLNPHLLPLGVAEDACHLASSFSSEMGDFGQGARQRIRFTLKRQVFWHDGSRFTAYDVAFTILSLLGEAGREISQRSESTSDLAVELVNQVPMISWSDLLICLVRIELHGAHALDIYTDDTYRWAHEWFGDIPIVPRHVWRTFGADFGRPLSEYGTESAFIGTGPFQYVSEGNTDGLVLRRFERYHHT